ncbi:hypothetical protein K435DRAFT_796972 [Dendrothele bispora CBS 962.96]|uniref:Uncharacterized protein n=1 Tax=Dendrothele bispora (strain CBS 962.96) TaxID=1314807 RepID=A0A4S8M539_DENBC|nr:hypothetical protein K435DRAFT_796972 [Dendrothele bispora CBS 962.96]
MFQVSERNKCGRCSRILRFKHFVPVSLITKYEQSGLTPEIFSKLTKSCNKCRASATQRNARKETQAEAAGQHWCTSCQSAVSREDCRDGTGNIHLTCNKCHTQVQNTRRRLNVQMIPDEDVPAQDDAEGAKSLDSDPYDAIFGDGSDMMEIDMPKDFSIDDKTCHAISRGRVKLKAGILLTVSRKPVELSKGNNVCPYLTELEEQMILLSLNLSVMSVRYTEGQQYSYKDHDITNTVTKLPRRVSNSASQC